MEPFKDSALEALVASFPKNDKKRHPDQPNELNVGGVTEAARPYVIAGTPSIQRGPVLILAKDNEQAAIWENELRFWLKWLGNNGDINVLRYDELPESEQLSQIPSLRRYRNLGVLARMAKKERSYFIVPIRSFIERVPLVERFKESILKIQKGKELGVSKVLHDLEELGYEPDATATTLGTFARRGDIVEFYSPNYDQPIRLEFIGSTLENIHFFNIKTKKNEKSLEDVQAIPLKLLMSQGRLINYVQEPGQWTVIKDDPEELKSDIDPLGSKNAKEWKNITTGFASTTSINFHAILEDQQDKTILKFSVPPLFRGHIPSLRDEIKDMYAKKWRVLILSGDPNKLEKSVEKQSKHAEFIKIDGTLRQNFAGFKDKKTKLLVLTDREIYGPETVQPKRVHKAKQFDQAFVSNLEPGNFVVHVDHGIGRFLGMVRNLLQGVEKEYFVIQYAEGDRLYLPVEAGEKLSKYIGAANPAIHRLSETSWLQIRAQLKESTEKLAKELLQLYAERQFRKGTRFKPEMNIEKDFAKTFPYDETPDQLRAWEEIKLDMERPRPMDRLLVGDVGFGKTELALRAAFKAAANNQQAVVLAPTTILADQHFKNFTKRFENFPFSVGVLSRFQSQKEQKETVAKLKAGTLDVVIGTHRLFSKDIEPKNLGVVIIDEEQRFGVQHKERLKQMRTNVHVLSLSATPIPRTLQFSLSGIRDISTIETPPPGRYPIETKVGVFDDKEVKRAIEFELERGGQVYVMHNRVETIDAFAEKIASLVPKAKVQIGHGQLPEQRLSAVMNDFYHNKFNVLVASTIIENGLDIPSVNTIIVDRSTHFGLAQLYQLRGRIGRGNKRAYAYLFYNRQDLKGPARSRLMALLEATELGSGFQIALRDLELRGAGNLLGGEQTGQIRSVGLNMYLRLLQRAVQELKSGVKETPVLDVTLDLPLAAYLPVNYIREERERLSLYQYLASITDIKRLDQERATMDKDHGELPTQANNFFRLLKWKLMASKAQVLSMTTTGVRDQNIGEGRLNIEFVGEPKFARINTVLSNVSPAWELQENFLRITFEELGKEWPKKLEKTLRILGQAAIEENKKSNKGS